ncbi:MAG: rmlC [Candidatus Acidoferrum typicum]|nr:rmlC [Candidatus Acidoferrum typicum]
MIFSKTKLPGVFVIEPGRHDDDRGFFARTFCREEFVARGLNADVAQCNVSFNKRKGTLRGMHYQVPPSAEVKLVRCTAGAIFDVIIDLRESSPTFRQHLAVELFAGTGKMLYVPEGFAHGFQTLVDDTEVFYQMSHPYAPECARGVRWDDPAFGIDWPSAERILLDRDRNYPDFATCHVELGQ